MYLFPRLAPIAELSQEKKAGRGNVGPEIGLVVPLWTRVLQGMRHSKQYMVDMGRNAGNWGYWATMTYADFAIEFMGSDAYKVATRYLWCRDDAWVNAYLPDSVAVVACRLYAR